jgi:hypothetical protein
MEKSDFSSTFAERSAIEVHVFATSTWKNELLVIVVFTVRLLDEKRVAVNIIVCLNLLYHIIF